LFLQQADIERLISNGLSLPEAPPALPGATDRARSVAAGMDTPYIAAQLPDTDQPPLGAPAPSGPSPVEQARATSVSMPPPPPATTMGAMVPLSLSMAGSSRPALAGVAPSQASAVTSASNAFEELPDGLNFGPNFGPDFFGIESWPALSQGWPELGQQFHGTGSI
jgi:poly [ADP-ribose] polymerase